MSLISVLSMILPFPVAPQTESVKFASSLGAGWNLGNTLDSWRIPEPDDTETCWGNPKAEKALFSLLRENGFSSVRIPVTWFQHLDADGSIEEAWLDRVNEVVDYVIDSGMFAVLNIQHDDQDWLITDTGHERSATSILVNIWKQIARRFAGYDEKLIFDIMNEPRVVGAETEWEGTPGARQIVNRMNASALKAIRESGGRNADRFVFITDYAASDLEENWAALEIPDDPHIMVSLHFYPGTAHRSEFKDCAEKLSLKEKYNIYKKLRGFFKAFAAKGIGVCITECGWTDRENLESLTERAKFVTGTANKFGFYCFVWDNGADFMLIDRNNLTVAYPEYTGAITGQKVKQIEAL